MQSNSRPEQTLHYHEKIYAVIADQDIESALKAMLDHLRETEAMINKLNIPHLKDS